MFSNIADKFQAIWKKLGRKGVLEAKDIEDIIKDIKMTLLEADVNFRVVKEFIDRVTKTALNSEITKSLTPGQHFIKIINDELTNILGTSQTKLTFIDDQLNIYILIGLQGAGKTTMAGKLALFFKKKRKKVLLIACDVYRPAAIKQLQVFGVNNSIEVFAQEDEKDAIRIASLGIKYAKEHNFDIAIVDTAGRSNTNTKSMLELQEMQSELKAQESILVIDAAGGQEAANAANDFNTHLHITSIIITKLDSDARAGLVLSIRYMIQKPIVFIGNGEKPDDIEAFHPDRIANRLLSGGDIATMVEQVKEKIEDMEKEDVDQINKNIDDLFSGDFTLQSLCDCMNSINKIGSIEKMMKFIPGIPKISEEQVAFQKEIQKKIRAMISSMTERERKNPAIIDASRKKRISKGSGTSVSDVNNMLKQFGETKKLLKKFTGGKKSLFNFFK